MAFAALAGAGALSAVTSFERAAFYRQIGVVDTPGDPLLAIMVAVPLLPVAVGTALVARALAWHRVSTR